MDGPEITRFAPSPTGYLHAGHAFAAWTAWRRARQSGGRFLLRIEDIDPERCRPAYAAAIEDDLRWLGLCWDGAILVQSMRLAQYRAGLDFLRARGLLYPCFCSRADIREVTTAPHGLDGGAPEGGAPESGRLYPGTCRGLGETERAARLSARRPHAMRLDIERALHGAPRLGFIEEDDGEIVAEPAMFGDVVLARRGLPASYHFCVTHDDAAQGVTLVTRAADLKPATHLHRLLQHLMGWKTPRYAHHQLLTDHTGERLSKRNGAPALRALRANGAAPADILAGLRIKDSTSQTARAQGSAVKAVAGIA